MLACPAAARVSVGNDGVRPRRGSRRGSFSGQSAEPSTSPVGWTPPLVSRCGSTRVQARPHSHTRTSALDTDRIIINTAASSITPVDFTPRRSPRLQRRDSDRGVVGPRMEAAGSAPPPPSSGRQQAEASTSIMQLSKTMSRPATQQPSWVGVLEQLQAVSNSATDAAKRTILSGMKSRLFVQNTSSNAIKGLVSGLLTDVCGVNVEIRGACRVLSNGLLLDDLLIGTDMTVRGVFVRAQLEPLIAVLKSWQTAEPGTPAPPILLQAISVRGVRCNHLDVHGLMKAFCIFRDAPGSITIGRLSLVNVQARFAQHDSGGNPPARWLGGGWGDYEPGVTIKRMEFSGMDSDMTLAEMSASIVSYREQEDGFKPVALLPAAPEGGRSNGGTEAAAPTQQQTGALGLRQRGLTLLNLAKDKGVENVIPKKWGDWLPPVVTKTMNQSLQQTSAVENLGPVLETSMAALMVQGAEGFATALNLSGAGLDTLRAAAGTEAVLDAGLVLALLAQGLPRWFLSREGASLLLKMVETGIAAALLKQGNLLKRMVDTRLLERMLELNLLESVLTRGDLTKKLISQGILGDMLELDIIEAMVKPANVPVLFQLLEGELLQVMVDSNILYGIKEATYNKPPPPPVAPPSPFKDGVGLYKLK